VLKCCKSEGLLTATDDGRKDVEDAEVQSRCRDLEMGPENAPPWFNVNYTLCIYASDLTNITRRKPQYENILPPSIDFLSSSNLSKHDVKNPKMTRATVLA
jgi:hypothetical protein